MRTNTLIQRGAAAVAAGAASPGREERVYRMLAAAFAADPVVRWVLPGERLYRSVFPRFAKAYAGRSFEHGHAMAAGDGRGAALWLAPGVEPDVDSIVGLFEHHLAPAAFAETMALLERMGGLRPTEPHWYLALFGVEPKFQGSGIGGTLLAEHLGRCDRNGETVYLESSNPKNISLYLRHGFEIAGEIEVGSAPVLWSMLRNPR